MGGAKRSRVADADGADRAAGGTRASKVSKRKEGDDAASAASAQVLQASAGVLVSQLSDAEFGMAQYTMRR